jgi:extradiol dioxygenase family protein
MSSNTLKFKILNSIVSILSFLIFESKAITMSLRPFHLAIPVHDLTLCRAFYRDVIGCTEGRSSEQWVDFDFYGHQLVIHEEKGRKPTIQASNPVDGHEVPIPHFGVVLSIEQWESLAQRLKENGQVFIIEPYIRFKGEVGEQATLFFLDPSGNALEFKAFKDLSQLFAK